MTTLDEILGAAHRHAQTLADREAVLAGALLGNAFDVRELDRHVRTETPSETPAARQPRCAAVKSAARTTFMRSTIMAGCTICSCSIPGMAVSVRSTSDTPATKEPSRRFR